MSTPRILTAVAVAGISALAAAAPVAGASAPPEGGSSAPPDASAGAPFEGDLAFLQTEVIDGIVAEAENANANCAALEALGGTMFMVAMSASSSDETQTTELGSHPMELFIAVYAPTLVPLLERTTPPADPTWAGAIDVIGSELRATIGELRELGLTDEDILLLQEDPMSTPSESSSPAEATMPPQYEAMFNHDFASLTFLDPDGALAGSASSGLENLWGDECPETSAMFSFDMEPVDIEMDASVVVGGSEPVGELNVTVNGTEVPVPTAG